MYFTLKQLEIFCSAARTLNFARTAEQLHISPPGVSKQIKNLEDQVNCQLFERVGRSLYLTRAGQLLFEHAQRIETEVTELKTLVKNEFVTEEKIVRLMITHTFENLVFRIIHDFSANHPDINFDIDIVSPRRQIEALKDNKTDIIITDTTLKDKNLQYETLQQIDFKLIASAENTLSTYQKIKINQLSDQQFIIVHPHSKLGQTVEKILQKYDLHQNNRLTLNSFVAVKDAISANLGIGVLPTTLVTEEINNGSLVVLPLEGFSFTVPLFFVYLSQKSLSQAMTSFIEYLHQY